MSDYSQLQADITTMLVDTTISTDICLRLANAELNRVMRLRGMISTATLTPALSGERYIASLPSDFLELMHVEVGGTRLELRSANNWDADDDDIYTIMGSEIHVTGSDDIDLWYYASAAVLSGSNTSNIFTTEAYDAYLYLALGHASIQQNRADMAKLYTETATELMLAAQVKDDESRYSGAPIVQGPS